VNRTLAGSVVMLVLGLGGGQAFGQSRPLVTQDPETVGPGQILFETGVDRAQDAHYPASGLEGNLWRVGTFGFSFGVSPIAEIQLDGGIRNILAIKQRFPTAPLASLVTATGTSTADIEDALIGAKIRFLSETERRPAMAFRFTTRLPNASVKSGLGLDTTDFSFGLALAKTIQSVRVVGNFGWGILGDPQRGGNQNRVLNYGASVARAIATGVEVVAEINGRLNTRGDAAPIGTDSRSVTRVGARLTRGSVRFDGAFLFGVTDRDPSVGFTAGLTWVFKGFTVPER
jgi:hypothetical protein